MRYRKYFLPPPPWNPNRRTWSPAQIETLLSEAPPRLAGLLTYLEEELEAGRRLIARMRNKVEYDFEREEECDGRKTEPDR
ncbi:hypothetical protein E2F50_15710 [Rhizobium deserti]|uniref:Uncharacterized protein n=1 Tax=Rhizobium deserti TaxID=2547961 RepID=A0A4R5UI56_9HYPH|nr:hypothetical protein [Rhizobium deserti]TDK35665.1 hypothetical protein E2F50_15710 [Rhizobium deserti]